MIPLFLSRRSCCAVSWA